MPTITKVLEFRALAEGENIKDIAIVDTELPAVCNQLLDQLRANGASKLFLAWEGSKIPRGVELPNGVIVWTQHGIVTGEDGKKLGFYRRHEEFGGSNNNRHIMIISLR